MNTENTYQERVHAWMLECFGAEIAADKIERCHRFIEEALELVQSLGCTKQDAIMLVDYVYGRPIGEPFQEVGGAMVTLAALCNVAGLDMVTNGETEFQRVLLSIDKIREKQATKPKHSPLPQKQMTIAYIAHPIGAVNPSDPLNAQIQVETNLKKVKKIARSINLEEYNVVPFAPYYLDCVAMDDNIPSERQRGIDNGTALLKAGFIDELRLYGSRISFGMMCEIALAKKYNIPVFAMTPETKEQLAVINQEA